MNIYKIINKNPIKNIILALANPFLSEHDKLVLYWKRANFDKTIRLNYPLNRESIVFDLGGYEGQWTSDIFSKYCCKIFVFEPINKFADNIKERFKFNEKIFVYPFGLASKTQHVNFYLSDDGTTEFGKIGEIEKVKLVDFNNFVNRNKIKKIFLMKLNIEGGEYDLLEYIIEIGWVKNIDHLQIQFHDFVPSAEKRMIAIQKELSKTHRPTYKYKFLWESWSKK